jgi:hypothetical protein
MSCDDRCQRRRAELAGALSGNGGTRAPDVLGTTEDSPAVTPTTGILPPQNPAGPNPGGVIIDVGPGGVEVEITPGPGGGNPGPIGDIDTDKDPSATDDTGTKRKAVPWWMLALAAVGLAGAGYAAANSK